MKRRSRKNTAPPRRKAGAKGRAKTQAARRRARSGSDPNQTIAQLRRELAEAREQQSATSEVLKVIASSPGALQPVFDAVISNATQLCEAKFGTLFLAEGSKFRSVAMHNLPPSLAEARRREPLVDFPPDTVSARAMAARKVIQIENMAIEPSYLAHRARYISLVDLGGARSVLFAPLIKDRQSIGIITIFRQEIRPFTNRHVELVKSFAAQAVIAIENTRLLNELRQRSDDLSESLEQQTATSEVLKVISGSPGDLQPVFQAMLDNATRICEAKFGTLFRYDGNLLHRVASTGTPRALVEFQEKRGPFHPLEGDRVVTGRMFREKTIVQITDIRASSKDNPPAKFGGARSIVGVPMLKDNEFVGAFIIYRQEVRPFTDKQIELLSNFAAQAVIAIENARLLNELRQSLDRQTATSEVLGVISSSPGELKPVFQAMLVNATRICEASFGTMMLLEGDAFRRVALHNAPPEYAAFHDKEPLLYRSKVPSLNRVIETKQAVQVADMAEAEPASPITRLGRARTLLTVPMLKDDELVGAIGIYRKEVRPFTDKQIELLSNFAAQAVIAIENTRLLNEAARSAGAADRDLGGAGRHFKLARRACAGVPGHAAERHPHLRGQDRHPVPLRQRRLHRGRDPWRDAGNTPNTSTAARSGPGPPPASDASPAPGRPSTSPIRCPNRPTPTVSRSASRPPSSAAPAACSTCRCSRRAS